MLATLRVLPLLFLFALALATCKRDTDRTKIVVTGSSTIAPLMTEIARRYELERPTVRVDVQTGGSARGLADVGKGLAAIGMVSRGPRPDETVDLVWHSLAGDGICLIVHASNPLNTLSDEQVVAVFTGKLSNWKELAGKDTPISVVNKAEGRSTLEVFLGHFKLTNADIKADVVIGDNQQGIKTVAGNPGAIGYVSVGAAEFEARRGTPIKPLSAGKVAASVVNVRNGSYPIARTLHLVTRGEPGGETRRFIDFARSEEVNDLVQDQFFVPLAR